MFNLLESSKRKNTLYLIREWQRKFGTRFNEVFCGPRAGAALGQSKQHRPTIVGRRSPGVALPKPKRTKKFVL
jgi:hypothetical protein